MIWRACNDLSFYEDKSVSKVFTKAYNNIYMRTSRFTNGDTIHNNTKMSAVIHVIFWFMFHYKINLELFVRLMMHHKIGPDLTPKEWLIITKLQGVIWYHSWGKSTL